MTKRSTMRLAVLALLLLAMLLPSSTAQGQSVIATIPVGVNPQGVAVNPFTNRIYVANQGSNDIFVIDGVSNSVFAITPVGNEPRGVDVNPGTKLIYVTNQGSNNVAVIDGASNAVVANIAAGGASDLATNPQTGRVYVTNGSNNTVAVIQDQAEPPPVTINARVSAEEEGQRTVDISITNNTDSSIPHFEIRGVIPEGATLTEATPGQFQIVGVQVVWFNQKTLGPDEGLTGFQYKFS